MNRTIDAIVFDMDGLLIDTERVALDSYLETAEALRIDATVELFVRFIGRNWPTTQVLMEEALGPEDAARMLAAWPEAFDAHAQRGIPKKPGADDLLRLLQRRGTPIALATSTAKPRAAALLEAVGLLDHFPIMAAGDEVANGKPAPDIFLLAAERLRVNPAACLVLEDSEAGVQAAHAAGMRVIMVPDLKPPPPEIAALAERVCGSLVEVRAILGPLLPD